MFAKYVHHPHRSLNLNCCNLLHLHTAVCLHRGRREVLEHFFSQEDGVAFCNDVCSVMEVLGNEYNPDLCRLFTIHRNRPWRLFYSNRNTFPSVPLAHTANTKGSYESIKQMLGKITYDECKWTLFGDLEVVSLLLGMQLGYTKFCCLLCGWASRDKKNHCVNKLWLKRTPLSSGEKNVVNPPLVLPEKNFLPPLDMKLGLVKNSA